MSQIIKLDKTLANQIAAGEVVERPISVIKELVENSIDAGASEIKVEILNGGIDGMIITDNGKGIEKDDLSLALDKYSTSKIKSLDDLYNVMTFGFRGEALASISSVSKFQIISKTQNSSFGYSIEVIDGDKSDITEYPSDNGTKIVVNSLFYNTPARLNYLKKPRTEYSKISEFLNQIALSYPNVGFELVNDGKKVFKYAPGEDLETRIYNIYGDDFASNVLEINFDLSGVKVSGYISDPKVSFPNKNKQSLFVNKRVIKSPLIFKAINDSYNRFIPHGTNPAYVLNIDIDPTQVDVNVHPRKLEVRFAAENQIFRGVYHAIEQKLNNVSLVTGDSISDQGDVNSGTSFSSNNYFQPNSSNFGSSNGGGSSSPSYYTGSGTKFKSYSPYKDITPNPAQGKINDAINFSRGMLSDNSSSNTDEGGYSVDGFEKSNDLHYTPLGKIIGQAHNSYIIVETKEGIKFLDQHALAERIIYEKLVKGKTEYTTQGLLIGESINLGAKELDLLETNKATFEDMGFDFEIMGRGIIMINGVPDFIKKDNLTNIFLGILDDLGEYSFTKSNTLQEVRNKIFAYTACRSAIKFGHKLNLFEMNKLLCDSVTDYSATCPHGRPVVFDISLKELTDKYERS